MVVLKKLSMFMLRLLLGIAPTLVFLLTISLNLSAQENPAIKYETQSIEIKHSYHYAIDTNKHWKRKITLPAIGSFVQEAHYVTKEDTFPNQRLFANSIDENITLHLQRSFELYHQIDSSISFNELYNSSWKKKWTPAENGKIGQGSVGAIQKEELTPYMELWMMNMMWDNGERPKRGTRFLLTYQNKRVIVIAGYETGPSAQKHLGGVTTEVHTWLGTNNDSQIEIAYLVDQKLKPGPVK